MTMTRKLIKPNFRQIKQNAQKESKRKPPPPYKTHAENYYYIKQMNNRTHLVLQLTDGETLKGILEWYDEKCIKIKKENGENLILFKSQIKYIYKNPEFADDRGAENPD